MLLTIWNFTHEPISGFVNPERKLSNRFSLRKADTPSVPLPPPTTFDLHPHIDFSTTLPKGSCREITLLRNPRDIIGAQVDTTVPASVTAQSALVDADLENPVVRQGVNISMSTSTSWKVVAADADTPWTLILTRVTRSHRKLIVFKKRNMASFLSELPDRLPLSSLLLPGTHDTMSLYGWPISQCQSVELGPQLQDGIRVIDIRLAVIPPPQRGATMPVIGQRLIAYHGVFPEQAPFDTILQAVHGFLTSPAGRRETIIMSIKQEDAALTPPPYFSEMVRRAIMTGPGGWDEHTPSSSGVNHGIWFLENRIPTLGEVRGKVILLSRFGGDGSGWPQGLEGMGIHPTTWPDSQKTAFEWELKGTLIRTHDWYAIPTTAAIPEKINLGTANLIPPRNSPRPVLPITFFSGSSFPLALPPTVAKGLPGTVEGANSRLGKWLLQQIGGIVPASVAGAPAPKNSVWNRIVGVFTPKRPVDTQAQAGGGQEAGQEPRIRGWAMVDFYSEPSGVNVVPLLVECNFLGRTPGEEGW